VRARNLALWLGEAVEDRAHELAPQHDADRRTPGLPDAIEVR